LAYLYLNYQVYKRLDYFPLLERSSRLIFMSLNCMTITQFYLPLVFYLLTDDYDQ
jgi:hypothetical protein